MYNKEEQIKVYVMIGTIIMLLVIFSGITYAFFSASNSTSIIELKSGKNDNKLCQNNPYIKLNVKYLVCKKY